MLKKIHKLWGYRWNKMKNTELESPFDPILQADLEDIVNRSISVLDNIKGSSVFITGATGLIGSLAIKALACANRQRKTDIQILALVRDMEKARRVFGSILHRPNISIIIGDINDKIKITQKVDYVIHGANATASKYFVTNPVETITTALRGTENVLDLSVLKGVKGMVYLSSMEVYGQTPDSNDVISENELGNIDILDTRSSYSESKRMAECLCASYAFEYNIPVKIARLSRVVGPGGGNAKDNRILTQFARCVADGHDIILRSTGETMLNYCYTTDAISAIFTLMIKGKVGDAYNASNDKDVVTVSTIAQMLIKNYPDAGIRVLYDIPEDAKVYGYNKTTTHKLDNKAIRALGCNFKVDLIDAFDRLIQTFLFYSKSKNIKANEKNIFSKIQ